jgi:hypothetical protein
MECSTEKRTDHSLLKLKRFRLLDNRQHILSHMNFVRIQRIGTP